MRRSHRTNTQTDTPGHQHGAFTPKKPATSKNLRGRKSVEYGHHMSRGSYDPMNCTASCFVVGPHLMMVSETFPLFTFSPWVSPPQKRIKVRPVLSRVLVILRLARRACLSWERGERVPACASALARVSACARALSTTWRSEAKSRLVCLAQAVLVGVSFQTRLLKTLAEKTFSQLRSGARAGGMDCHANEMAAACAFACHKR